MADVQIKEVRPMTALSHSFTGPYEQSPDKLAYLMSWLLRDGHPYSDTPRALFYDDPAKVAPDALRAEVVLPIEEECEGGDDIERKSLPGGLFACAIHEGPYETVRRTYQEIFDWIAESEYAYLDGEPVREIYLTMYGQVDDPEEFVTEVQVPVQEV